MSTDTLRPSRTHQYIPAHQNTPLRSSSRGARYPVQQVICSLFQASHQSPLTAMLVVEGAAAGFTAFVARWRNQTVTTQCTASVTRALLPSPPRRMPSQPPRASAKVQTRRAVGRNRGRARNLVQEKPTKARLSRGLLWTKSFRSCSCLVRELLATR